MDIMSLKTQNSFSDNNDPFEKLNSEQQNTKVESALKIIVNMILDCLTPALAKVFISKLLDMLEDLTKRTNTKIDDIIVYALCNKARQILNIEENEESFDSNVSQFIKSDMDKYTSEIDFGKTDTFQSIKSSVTDAINKKQLMDF